MELGPRCGLWNHCGLELSSWGVPHPSHCRYLDPQGCPKMSLECLDSGWLSWGQSCCQDLETQARGRVLPKVWKLLVEKSFSPSMVVVWEKFLMSFMMLFQAT